MSASALRKRHTVSVVIAAAPLVVEFEPLSESDASETLARFQAYVTSL